MVKVSKSLYSKEVLLKTAFGFTDKAFIHLEQDEASWIVSWKPRAEQEIDEGEFENELISQSLREELLEQTSDLRRIILARAFASTVMDDNQVDHPVSVPINAPAISEEAGSITEEEKARILKGWFDQ